MRKARRAIRFRTGFLLLVATGLIWGTIGVAGRLVFDRTDLDALEDLAAEHLEGAVDIADANTEERPHQHVPSPGIDQPMDRVLALRPVTRDDVVVFGVLQKLRQFIEVKLTVGV